MEILPIHNIPLTKKTSVTSPMVFRSVEVFLEFVLPILRHQLALFFLSFTLPLYLSRNPLSI
jgi:hypothetical protein